MLKRPIDVDAHVCDFRDKIYIQCATLKSERIFLAIRFSVKGLLRGGHFYRVNLTNVTIKKYVLVERKTLDFLAMLNFFFKISKLSLKNSIVSLNF